MAGHLAVVSATKKKMHHVKHAHPVRRMTISPTDNGGFTSETEMHPPPQTENGPYMPPETVTGAHANGAQMMKHVKAMMLKTDEQEGNGMTDPGSAEDAEDKA